MPITRQCAVCSTDFEARRPDAVYCTPACRSKAHRRRKKAERTQPPAGAETVTAQIDSDETSADRPSVLACTVAELAAVDLATSASGLGVIALALRIDHPNGESGASLVALVREHRSALREVLASAKASSGDDVDEVKRKREERRARAANGR